MNALWFDASPRSERYAINALTAEDAGEDTEEISAASILSKVEQDKTQPRSEMMLTDCGCDLYLCIMLYEECKVLLDILCYKLTF